jgi:hypothetical protein
LFDPYDARLKELKDWVIQVLGPIEVSLAGPEKAPAGMGVGLYLFELANAFPADSAFLPPLKLELHYLVTAWAEKPEEAHSLLVKLALAALANSRFEVDLAPLPPGTWSAFAIPPRPAFILRVPLLIERPEPDTGLVTQPLVVHDSPLVDLAGQVVGPQDLPLVNARVEIPLLNQSTYTDQEGRFRFPAVPARPGAQHLRIISKGQTLEVDAEQPSQAHERLVIHFYSIIERMEQNAK